MWIAFVSTTVETSQPENELLPGWVSLPRCAFTTHILLGTPQRPALIGLHSQVVSGAWGWGGHRQLKLIQKLFELPAFAYIRLFSSELVSKLAHMCLANRAVFGLPFL